MLAMFYIIIGIVLSLVFYFVVDNKANKNQLLQNGKYKVINEKSQTWFGKEVSVENNTMTSDKNGKWHIIVNMNDKAEHEGKVVFQRFGNAKTNVYNVKYNDKKLYFYNIVDGKSTAKSIVLQEK